MGIKLIVSNADFSNVFLGTKTEDRIVILKEELRDVGFLVTEEYYATIVNDSSKSQDFFGLPIIGTNARVVFSYDVSVCAGIDFEEADIEINNRRKIITITLPEAEILANPSIDTDSYVCYLDTEEIFTRGFSSEEYNAMSESIQTSAVERALNNGILERAQENADTIVRNFVSAIISRFGDYDDYEIIVEFD